MEEYLAVMQYTPFVFGCWVSAVIGGISALAGMSQGQPEIKARALSEDEKQIINRMEQLAVGNPELGDRYTEYTRRAVSGEPGFSPGLERDLAEQEAKVEQGIARGIGEVEERLERGRGALPSTAAIQARETFRTGADVVRGEARREAMALGEQLLASRTSRLGAAAGTALAPLAEARGEKTAAGIASAAGRAQEKAGLMQTAGTLYGAYAGSKQQPTGGINYSEYGPVQPKQ